MYNSICNTLSADIKARTFFPATFLFALLLPLAGIAQSLNPEFSKTAGFYNSQIEVQISVDHPDAMIFYTTDGSVPTLHSGQYTEPLVLESREGDPNIYSEIPTNSLREGHQYRENWRPPAGEVFKIHVLRAIAFLPDGESGEVTTASYLIDEKGSERYSMAVFSIATDPENLFSDENGIYVPGRTGTNFLNRGREWERDVHIEFFEADGQLAISQDAGVRIHGGTTRNRPRKSLRFYARSDYGTSWFNYPLFPDKPVTRYKRFLLRNSGNDWSESVFRDAYLQRLIQGSTDLDIQYSRPAILFINGEYWGIHNIRDRFDDRYLQAHYGLDDDRVIMMQNNAEFDDGNEEGVQSYHELYDFITGNSMGDQANFEYAARLMDMDNFIDYQILNIYTRNTDWPGNNVRYWRYLDGDPDEGLPRGQDGRWRWMAFDLDFGFGLDFDYVVNSASQYGGNDAYHNTLNFALESNGPDWPNPPWSTAKFRALMQNSQFMEAFINRFADLLNTSFRSGRAVELLDTMKDLYEPEMDEHIHRWREPSRPYWEDDTEVMRTFAEMREEVMRGIINNRFNLGGSNSITLNVNNPAKGTIQVNSLVLDGSVPGIDESVFPWTGNYFSNQPIQLIARPEAGYTFTGWSGHEASNSDTLIVAVSSDMDITANFSDGTVFEGDEMNPEPFNIGMDHYEFRSWSTDEPEGSFPPHMIFQQSSVNDPGLDEEMTHPYFIPFTNEGDNEYHPDDQDKFGFPYKLTGRTRINGLGNDGISMINTGRGRDLGAVVLALDTREAAHLSIHWIAQTLQANSRAYNVRLQYRIGLTGSWENVLDEQGNIVEYERDDTGKTTTFEYIPFPEDAYWQPYVQLRWKYYYTGERLSEESGQRDEIRIDDIIIENGLINPIEETEAPGKIELYQNYPNPFNPSTTIYFSIDQTMDVKLEVFDALGRQIAVLVDQRLEHGMHQAIFDASGMASGLYLYRLALNGDQHVRRMTLIK